MIPVIIVICLICLAGLVGLLMFAPDIRICAPKTGRGEASSTIPWQGQLSICCPSSYAPADVFRRILGWRVAPYERPAHVVWWSMPTADFYHEQAYTKQQGKQSGRLKNQLILESLQPVIDKSQVFRTMLNTDPEYSRYLPSSWLVNDFRKLLDSGGPVPWPVAVKNPDSSVQMGVWFARNLDDFEKIVAEKPFLKDNPRVTVNQYVSPPLLWYDRPSSAMSPEPEDADAGKKFHIRVFIIFMVRAGVVHAWIPDYAKIMTAKLPYTASDYDNLDIHLSGGSRTAREFWWQQDAAWHLRKTPEEINQVWKSSVECMLAVAHSAAPYVETYPESPAGYHLLGADILPDASLKCWFLEVNRRPSWLAVNHDSRSVAITAMHCKFQIENIVRPFFGLDFARRPPDGAYPSKTTGPLTPYTAELVAGAGARETMSGWEFAGDLKAAKVLRDLAVEARKLPASSQNPLEHSKHHPPAEPVVGMTWKNMNFSKHHPREGLSCYVIPADAPDGGTPTETLSEWIRGSLGMKMVSGGTRGDISLVYSEPGAMVRGFGKGFNETPAALKSALGNRDSICDKTKLFETMRKYGGEKYTPSTWVIPDVPEFARGDVYIVKQRGSSGQEGVYVVDTPEGYVDAIKRCTHTGGVVQEYIKWPLTSRGRKMHIRAYLAVYITGGVARAYYASDVHKIMTARTRYVAGDWGNRDIHISGGDYTDEWLEWPWDTDCAALDACTAQDSIDKAMAAVGRAACATMIKYPDCVGGFHVFGADIIIDARALHDLEFASVTPSEERMRAIVLEVNDRPGLGMRELNPEKYEQLSWRYLTWLDQSVVGQHFGTTAARAPIACGPVADPRGDQRLAPFQDLLKGSSYVNVIPSAWTKNKPRTYGLRAGDNPLGTLIPVSATDYVFEPAGITWSSNEEMNNSTRIHECGVAILSIAWSTPKKQFKYNVVRSRVGSSGVFDSRRKKSYFVTDQYINKKFLSWLVPGKEWAPLKRVCDGERIDWLAGMVSIKTYPETPATLKVKLNTLELTDKVRLHSYANEFPGVLAETFEISKDSRLPTEGIPWIVRANWAWAGSGNTVVTTTAGMLEAYTRYAVKPDMFKNRTPARVIASRYIEDPMLLDTGHKFHARAHVFLQMGPRLKTRAVILPTVYLMSSEHPYVANDWGNHEIHDTHGRYRGGFRADISVLPDHERLRKNTFEAIRRVFRAMIPRISMYPDTENAYEFFGIDVMYLKSGEPVILEVNDNPGIKATWEIETAIQSEMLREIANCVLETFEGAAAGSRRIPNGVLPRSDIKPVIEITLAT